MSAPRGIDVSQPARADLRGIADNIGSDSPRTAQRFVNALERRFLRVATMPSAYPSRGDLALGLRMAVHQSYLIFFREIDDRTVRIERVLYTAHDLRRLF